jgi:NAD(P)H dehydrogenase (quinone)
MRIFWWQTPLRLADFTSNDNKKRGGINMYAVMGITGNVGGAVARALLGKREKVRGIVRNPEKAAKWQKQGAELFKADYDDVDALTAAFMGVAGVFVMVPPNFAPVPGFAETKATLKVLREALSRALPSKAVYLSSIGAEQASALGLITSSHLLEEMLGDLPFSHAFLRAGWFFENSAGDVTSAWNEGKIRFQLLPLDRKLPLVATADIGKVGAETLTQSWTGIRHIEVAGPEGYSPLDIVDAFADAVGHPSRRSPFPGWNGRRCGSHRGCRRDGLRLGRRWSMDSIPVGFTLAYPEQSMRMERRRFVR